MTGGHIHREGIYTGRKPMPYHRTSMHTTTKREDVSPSRLELLPDRDRVICVWREFSGQKEEERVYMKPPYVLINLYGTK